MYFIVLLMLDTFSKFCSLKALHCLTTLVVNVMDVKFLVNYDYTIYRQAAILVSCIVIYKFWQFRWQLHSLVITSTLQPLYNTVRYNTVLDITWFKDGSQKCIDYIEK